MALTSYRPDTNRLIDGLPEKDREHFLADCSTVDLELGQVLAEPGERIQNVHFPLGCMISLIVSLDSRAQLEVSLAGREGMTGADLMLGAQSSQLRVLVQGAGPALSMSSSCFLRHLEESPALARLIKRYLNVLLSQISRSAACAHYHELEARLARCLLMTHDRTAGNRLHLTHQLLSTLLGVRRAGVTDAARALRLRGLIDYRHGNITVVDRPGLEAASCLCYDADRQTYEEMLGHDA